MKRGRDIRSRVLVVGLVPTTLVVLVLVGLFSYLRAHDIEVSLRERGATIARHLARAAEFGLFSGDRKALQGIADDALLEADVDSVQILGAKGEVMARSGRAEAPPGGDPRRIEYSEPVQPALLQFSDLPEAARVAPAPLGEVRLVMSRAATESAKRTGWLAAFAVGLWCLLLAAYVARSIGRSVADPVLVQAEAIRAIAAGDLGVRVQDETGGELGALAQGINRMAAALQASQHELEGRIAQATQKLQQQKEAAEEANQAKSRFLAAASHDLRQPLHAIELFAAALSRRVRGRETRELSEKLEQAILSMDTLFNALLDIYQLDAGVLNPELRAFPVQQVFDSLENEYRADAASRGLRLRFVPTPKVAYSDPILVHRVLANLVTNALRYTPQGSVVVACRRAAAGLRLEVRDSGPGIAADQQQNIFREFYRMENGRSDRGMGLGLTIVARICALLQTEIALRSAPGRGSTFSFGLARRADRAAAPPAGAREPAALRAPNLGVLLVDNDPLVLQSALALTRDWRVTVATASNGGQAQQALRELRQQTILVLTDLWLGGEEDGLQLLEILRAQTTRQVYGVVVTGDTRPATMQRIQAAGYPLLQKPVSAAKLRATLQYYVSKSSA